MGSWRGVSASDWSISHTSELISCDLEFESCNYDFCDYLTVHTFIFRNCLIHNSELQDLNSNLQEINSELQEVKPELYV